MFTGIPEIYNCKPFSKLVRSYLLYILQIPVGKAVSNHNKLHCSIYVVLNSYHQLMYI